MSRNFELLNQMGKAEVMTQPEVEPVPLRPAVDSAMADPSFSPTPTLEIDGLAREELTKLVHRLFLASGAEGPRRVVVTGPESGTGASWICAHAAEILAAQTERTVCLVDCNLKAPSLHEQFGVPNHFGLTDALVGSAPIRQYARPLSRRNLWMVSCGSSDEVGQTLLTSDRMRMRIAELSNEFDYLLLDVAPLNGSNHATVLGSAVDGVVLVLKANSSRRDSTRDAIQGLQASGVRVLGAVLNQRVFPIPENIYQRL